MYIFLKKRRYSPKTGGYFSGGNVDFTFSNLPNKNRLKVEIFTITPNM
jgi:hypothetical protein